jgi:cell division protein FtsI (penicillin-binding protein 3)
MHVITVAMLALFGVLGFNLYRIQVVEHEAHLADRERQTVTEQVIQSERGMIIDRNDVVFARSILVQSAWIVPGLVEQPEETADVLSETLGLDRDWVLSQIRSTKKFRWIKRKLSETEVASLEALDIAGLYFRPEFQRTYPMGPLAAHVIGGVGLDENGLEGMEHYLEGHLAGPKYVQVSRRDALTNAWMDHSGPVTSSASGLTVTLTIDAVIQNIVESQLDRAIVAHKPQSAVAIAMDPATGDILAIASRPTFNPNQWRESLGEDRKNRVLTDPFEPGSTFKVFVAAAAHDAGVARSSYDCENGLWRVGSRVIHDHHPYGNLPADDVVVVSSNIGAAKMAFDLKKDRLYEYVRAFGFGEQSGIDMPGEDAGSLTPYSRWSAYTVGSVSFGHEILCTPLQLVTAMSAIANGGKLMKPNLVHSLESPEGGIVWQRTPTVRRQVVSEAVSARMRRVLGETVQRGTGKRARLETFTTGGKTGTSQKVINGQYSHEHFIGSFLALAPVEQPRVVLYMALDDPVGAYYGGTVAAPYVGAALEEILFYLGEPLDVPGPVAGRH